MKQILLLSVLSLFLNANLFSQNWEWGKHVTGTENVFNQLTVVDASGNIIVAAAKKGTVTFVGTSYTLEAAANTPFLAKYNSNGSVAWLVNIGNLDLANIKGLAVDGQGNIIIAGMFRSDSEGCVFGSINADDNDTLTSSGVQDAYLAKYDNNGNLLWAYSIGQGTGDDRAFGVTTDSNNNIYVAGYFVSTTFNIKGAPGALTKTTGNSSGGDAFLVKYSSDASYLWHRQFSSTKYARNLGGIAPALDNGVYIAIDFTTSVSVLGTDPLISASAIGNKAVALFKILEDGVISWVRVVRGSVEGPGINIVQGNKFSSDDAGNLYAIGQANSTLTFDNDAGGAYLTLLCNGYDGWLAKYNSQGVLQWANIVGGLSEDRFYDVSYKDGVVSTAGFFKGETYLPSHSEKRDTLTNSGGQDVLLVNYNTEGKYLSSTRLGGTLDDEASSVAIMPDGNSVIGASFKSPTLTIPSVGDFTNGGNQDMILAKHINIHVLPEESPVLCNNGSDGSLKFTVFGGGEAPYTYSFAKVGGGEISSGTYSTPVTFEDLSAGTYYIDITDSQSRKTRRYYSLKNPDPITISANITNVTSCYGSQTGEISLTVTGGAGGYAYLWDSEDGYGYIPTVEDQSNITAGHYTVTVIDANGCEATGVYTVTQPSKINFVGSAVTGNTSSVPASPNGQVSAVANNAIGTVTYSWQGPNSFTSSNQVITNLRGGAYVLTVTANGCSADTLFNVPDQYLFNAMITSTSNPKCKGGSNGSATAEIYNSTGAVSISWSNGQTDVLTATNLSAGQYSVTLTDDMGTSGDAGDDAVITLMPVIINEPDFPLEVTTTVTKTTCPNSADGAIMVSINGWSQPYSYSWSASEGASGIVNGQKDQEGLTVGYYTVVVTDSYGCEITKNINMGFNYGSPSIVLSATPSETVIEGTSVTISATGGVAYEFFVNETSQGAASSTSSITIANPVTGTKIKAIGYNTAGCSGESNEITITVNPQTYTVTFTVSNKSATPIEGAQITVSGYSSITTNSTGSATIDLANGTYSYAVTAAEYYESNGNFAVTGTASNVSVVLTSTGIGDNTLSEIKAYPNPFGSEITISNAEILSRIEITTIIGQKVLDVEINNSNTINTASLHTGIYLVKFIAKNGDVVIRKMVKE